MGLSQEQVRKTSVPAFHAALEGFAQFNGGKPDGPTDDEFMAVLAEEIEAGRV